MDLLTVDVAAARPDPPTRTQTFASRLDTSSVGVSLDSTAAGTFFGRASEDAPTSRTGCVSERAAKPTFASGYMYWAYRVAIA